ncbi:hypothetical protein Poli38472_005600 [Pythium oligandrum]|uniref:Pre-mRNA processing factor 4 (PRP4)-like domain-containing protein n=1 Tax=Pythium oligandrum TaxID=41045 RepID=A0A8K1CIV4_PYTOL|nr:hypothetical protein Poli38472_005600 [Pythium oligandrum]|eukprot:TMW62982.1 hypothetical protein Poli38472_005600 [Pythium oligandrum]
MTDRKGIYFGAINGASGTEPAASGDGLIPSSVRRETARAPGSNSLLEAAIRAGNVNTADTGEKEVLQLSESSLAAQEKHAQLLRRIEAEKRARNISVPTSVEEVILRLRQLHQPITLFGEGPADRRERLRELLARIELEAEEGGFVDHLLGQLRQQQQAAEGASSGAEEASALGKDQKVEDQLFYIPVRNNELKTARANIFTYAAERTQKRLKQERLEKTYGPNDMMRIDQQAASLYATAQKMVNVASQNGDVRPLANVRYAPDAKHVATGSWSGLVKVWDANSANEVKVFRGHEDRITGLDWHPATSFSDMSDASDVVCLCSGSADSTAKLWSASGTEAKVTLKGHKARLGKVAFHPSGNYVGTTSFDHTWRLWDVATGQELLLQEGHYKEVYAIAFQRDGALAATGDLNGVGRVWDLRSGKAIIPLQGHSKQILSMDFALNGYQLASGSDDRTVRIWDLRQRKCSYTIPAHSNLVSDVQYSRTSGELLLTASYDATIKVWRTRDWKLLTTLKGHDGKVMGADFAPDEKHVVSCGFDRTFKFWAHESEF